MLWEKDECINIFVLLQNNNTLKKHVFMHKGRRVCTVPG